MADEPTTNTPEPGVPTEPQTPEENLEQVDRAELERLRGRDATLTKLDGYAKEADIDGAESYMEQLENALNQGSPPPAPEPVVDPPKTEPSKEPVTPPAPAGLTQDQLAELDASNKRSTQAMLDVHNLQWSQMQGTLPEEERSPAERKELDKQIMANPAAIRQLAADRLYGGNVYAAANALFINSSDGQRKIAERAEAIQKAKGDAAAGATIPTGGTTAVPSTATEAEKYAAMIKAEADKIAPDDPPYKPPIG